MNTKENYNEEVISVNQEIFKNQVSELVRDTVEKTLNDLLDAEALWGSKVSHSTISNLNQKVYFQIDEWRNRKLECEFPYIYLDGIYLKKSWGGEVRNVSILIAIGVNSEGYREVI